MNRTLVLTLGLGGLVACQTETAPSVAERPALFEFEAIASPGAGTLTIVKTVDHSASALFQQVAVQQNGVPNSGSSNTVELVTLSTGECDGPNTFGGVVQINSFFGSPLTDIVAQITSLTPAISVQPNNTESFPPLDNTNGLWVHGAPGSSKTWCFDVTGGADFRFRGRVFADVPSGPIVPATCGELLTNDPMWGLTATGVDLRARTASQLHWIGCPNNGCSAPTFFCSSGTGFINFGTFDTNSALRAMVDTGNGLGDTNPTSFESCSTFARPFDISNAPDSNAPPSGIDPVVAICAALGFPFASFVPGASANFCPEPDALAADGSEWFIDGDGSSDNEWAASYCCHNGGGCVL